MGAYHAAHLGGALVVGYLAAVFEAKEANGALARVIVGDHAIVLADHRVDVEDALGHLGYHDLDLAARLEVDELEAAARRRVQAVLVVLGGVAVPVLHRAHELLLLEVDQVALLLVDERQEVRPIAHRHHAREVVAVAGELELDDVQSCAVRCRVHGQLVLLLVVAEDDQVGVVGGDHERSVLGLRLDVVLEREGGLAIGHCVVADLDQLGVHIERRHEYAHLRLMEDNLADVDETRLRAANEGGPALLDVPDDEPVGLAAGRVRAGRGHGGAAEYGAVRVVAQLVLDLAVLERVDGELIARLRHAYPAVDAGVQRLDRLVHATQRVVLLHDVVQVPDLDRLVHARREHEVLVVAERAEQTRDAAVVGVERLDVQAVARFPYVDVVAHARHHVLVVAREERRKGELLVADLDVLDAGRKAQRLALARQHVDDLEAPDDRGEHVRLVGAEHQARYLVPVLVQAAVELPAVARRCRWRRRTLVALLLL